MSKMYDCENNNEKHTSRPKKETEYKEIASICIAHHITVSVAFTLTNVSIKSSVFF